jgi:hypothetical protein
VAGAATIAISACLPQSRPQLVTMSMQLFAAIVSALARREAMRSSVHGIYLRRCACGLARQVGLEAAAGRVGQ